LAKLNSNRQFRTAINLVRCLFILLIGLQILGRLVAEQLA